MTKRRIRRIVFDFKSLWFKHKNTSNHNHMIVTQIKNIIALFVSVWCVYIHKEINGVTQYFTKEASNYSTPLV